MNEHAAPRRVFRSRSDRVVAGVAGGFARYLGLDAAVVRLVLVVLAFVGGLGVLLYLAAWLVVPDEPIGAEGAAEDPPLRHGARVGWTVVVAIVAIAVLAEVGHVGFGLRPGILWPLALIGFGVAVLWLRAGDGPAAAAPAAPAWGTPPAPDPAVTEPGATASSTSSTSSAAWSAGSLPSSTAVDDPNAPSAPWRVAAVSPSPLRRAAPVLGRIAVAVFGAALALVVTAGIVLLVEGPGGVDVTPAWSALVGVLVVLTAVVVGLRIRRVPDLVAVTVPVLFVLAVACWVGPPFRGGFGSREVRPADVASLDRTYRLAGGTLVVDLGELRLGGRTRAVTASVATGRLRVVVPAGATVVVDSHVDAGEARILGLRDTGTSLSRRITDRAASGASRNAGAGTLRIHADVGFGQVVVERAGTSPTPVPVTPPPIPVTPTPPAIGVAP